MKKWFLETCILMGIVILPYVVNGAETRYYSDEFVNGLATVQVDALFWKMRRPGLSYAVVEERAKESWYLSGDEKGVDPQRDLGVRVSLTKDISSSYELGVKGTFYKTGTLSVVSVDASNENRKTNIVPLRQHPIISENIKNYTYADSDYSSQYRYITIQVAQISHLTWKSGIVKPYIGVDFLSLEQALKTRYATNDMPHKANFSYRTKDFSQFDAYGIHVGVDGTCNLGDNGLSLYGLIEGGLALGDSIVTWKVDEIQGKNIIPSVNEVRAENKGGTPIPRFECSLGLRYLLSGCSGYHGVLQVGYELHALCGLCDFFHNVKEGRDASLSDNGYNLGIEGLHIRFYGYF